MYVLKSCLKLNSYFCESAISKRIVMYKNIHIKDCLEDKAKVKIFLRLLKLPLRIGEISREIASIRLQKVFNWYTSNSMWWMVSHNLILTQMWTFPTWDRRKVQKWGDGVQWWAHQINSPISNSESTNFSTKYYLRM